MTNEQEWSEMIGDLAADALVDAEVIQKSQLKRASEIIAEEVLVRLSLKDRPQPLKHD